ncbi:hypothetical protein FRC02_007616 [Tulasnella sp. 418]|nr:hypothetical protein FRC02_007616 [Tulasnella sp. 418]
MKLNAILVVMSLLSVISIIASPIPVPGEQEAVGKPNRYLEFVRRIKSQRSTGDVNAGKGRIHWTDESERSGASASKNKRTQWVRAHP